MYFLLLLLGSPWWSQQGHTIDAGGLVSSPEIARISQKFPLCTDSPNIQRFCAASSQVLHKSSVIVSFMSSHQITSSPHGQPLPRNSRPHKHISRAPDKPRALRAATVIAVATALLASMLASTIGFSASPAGAIVKGTEAKLGDHPYQVALEDRDGQFCGGSLIATDIVLTAAHCLDGMNATNVLIRAGVVDLDRPGQLIKVTRSVVHEKWEGEDGDTSFDIALLFLEKSFALNANVGLIDAESAAVTSAAKPGTDVVVSGWGALGERNERIVTTLRHTNVKLINDTTCNKRLRDDSIDPFSMICTVGTGNGSCYGDSGGPLAKQNGDGSWTQVGIVSWGTVCGSRRVAGIYSDLANLRPWITSNRSGSAPAPAPAPAPKPAPKPSGVKVDVISKKGRITIPAFGEASASPSTMNVKTKGTQLVDVDVILQGFRHQRISDLDVILVSPEGTEVTLLGDAGGDRGVAPTGIRFDDAAATAIPTSGTIRGRYLPTNNVNELGPADLSLFEGEDPNGEWELYIYDAVEGKRGRVGAWTLVAKTR